MMFSEKRFALFGIMPWLQKTKVQIAGRRSVRHAIKPCPKTTVTNTRNRFSFQARLLK
jgi:hypothetical protein